MALFDPERLSQPISADAPCGPELRDETAFRELEEAPAEFSTQKLPELRQVVQRCHDMLARTKDHLPAIIALQAAVRIGDLALANTVLQVIRTMAEEHWEGFHPGPAEDMVPARLNELGALARPAAVALPLERASLITLPAPSTQGFTMAMIGAAAAPVPEWTPAEEKALAARIAAGQITAAAARSEQPTREGARTLRSILLVLSPAARALDADAKVKPAEAPISAELLRPLAEGLLDQARAAHQALLTLSNGFYELNEIYDARAGESASLGPVLAVLARAMAACDALVQAFAPEAAAETDAEAANEAPGAETGAAGVATAAAAAPARFVPSTPQSRDDVLRALDTIATYYREREPTSPLPLMLDRVRAWVTMDFMDLLREIAPGSIAEAQGLLAKREQ